MRHLAVVLATLTTIGIAEAQPEYWKHNISGGVGAGIPRGELRPFFQESIGVNVSYGYRFHPYFQADAGLETLFGAARIRDFLPTSFGDLRIRDYQFLVPFGGRVIVPFANERLHFSAGSGGAYLRYTERLRQPFANSGFTFDCPVCASRGGWGYYGLAGFSAAIDRARHFRIGVETRLYRAETDGDPFGGVPALATKDRWVNVFGQFTFSF